MNKILPVLILFCFSHFLSSAQLTDDGRGMYVDKFFRTAINSAGNEVVNPVFSILSVQSKENALLQYAKDNHITYLILYDLHRVFGNATYETYLCSFMQKAKTLYCIEKIGVASSCSGLFDNVAVMGPTPPVDFAKRGFTNYNPTEQVQLNLATESLSSGDSLFYRSEVAKLSLMMTAFNDNCAYKFDVLVSEYEFWNTSIDDCTGQTLTRDQKYVNYQGLINDMDVVRDNYNASHSHQIYVETYLGYIHLNTAYTHQAIANWIDGSYNGKRRVDRVNLHYYGLDPVTLYSRTVSGQNYTGYYANRFVDFSQPGTNNQTNFCPIYSSESTDWGAPSSFLGPWMSQDVNNNIFTAEKAFYNDWYDDATAFSPATIGHATLGTKVFPGAVVWFTAGHMSGHLNDPEMYTSNSPVCVTTGGSGAFAFEYQGPIEQGSSFKFYLTNTGTAVVRCGTVTPIAWPAYNPVTHTSIDLNAALNGCTLPVGDYDVHLELTYAAGCTPYIAPIQTVSITTTGKIVALTPTTACKGNPVFLQAGTTSGGSTTYQWYDGGTLISGATSSTYAPTTVGVHNYACKLVSSIGTCSANLSNVIPVTINAYPTATIAATASAGCATVLQASPSGSTYQWHDGSTGNTYATAIAGSYSVAVTRNGCRSTASYNYQKANVSLVSQTNTCNAGSTGTIKVNLFDGVAPYTVSWTGPTPGSSTGNAAGNKTISGLAAGTYVITVTDAGGCTKTLAPNPVVSANAAIIVTTSSVGPTCPTSTNGSATITNVTGGVGGPYTYKWLINNSTGATLSNIAPGAYIVQVTDGFPCSVSATVNVTAVNTTVVPSVSVISSQGNSICAGESVTFTATPVNGGVTPNYQWKKNGASVGTNNIAYTNTALVNGDIITCVMTSTAACPSPQTATSSAITMSVNTNLVPAVSISANPGNNICSGTPVTFTAAQLNGGASPAFQWKKNGLNVGTNSASYPSSTLANGDVITCVLTSTATCVTTPNATSNGISMTVNPNLVPAVSVSTNTGTTICPGTSVTFTAAPVNGGASPAFQWKKNGGNVGTNNISYATSVLLDGDVISCVLTSNATCISTPTAAAGVTMDVTANIIPLISISSDLGDTICPGTSVNFTASVINEGAQPNYQWKKNGANVGTNNVVYTVSNLQNTDVITCVLTSNANCVLPAIVTSNGILMNVIASVNASVLIGVTPGNTICDGTTVAFTASPVNGGLSPSYQWKKNGNNVGLNSINYSDNTFSNSDHIVCEMISNADCISSPTVSSNAIDMIVNPNVQPAVSINTPNNTACIGSNVTFTASPVYGGLNPSYQWAVNGNVSGTNSDQFNTNSLSDNDVVSCLMTSNSNCIIQPLANSNSITIDISTPVTPSVSIIPNVGNVICSGTNVTFSVSPVNGGLNPHFQWTKNGANTGFDSPNYDDYLINNNDVIACTMTSNAFCVSPQIASSNTVSMVVYPNLTPSVTISSNSGNSICSGTSVTFTANPVHGGFNPGFLWAKNGNPVGGNSTTYISNSLSNSDVITCSMNSNAACSYPSNVLSNSVSINVTNTVTPSINISSNTGTSICPGTNVTFSASPSNGGASPFYIWKNNGSVVGQNNSSYSVNTLSNNDIITCEMTSNAACVSPTVANSNNINMSVVTNLFPAVTITSDKGNSICTGTSVLFTASPVNGGLNPSYQWIKNGNNVGQNLATYSDNSINGNDLVTCTMISSDACAGNTPVNSNDVLFGVGPCGFTLHLKAYIQGFYEGGGNMRAVADPINNPTLCDTVFVDIRESVSPFNIVSSVSAPLNINGTGEFYFINGMIGQNYFVIVRHRNALEAWSKFPVSIVSANVDYDFSLNSTTAYGNNLVDLGDGNFALWSGDVTGALGAAQDGVIDQLDFIEMKNALHNFHTGYIACDLTGDGFIESADFSMVENNVGMLIVLARP